MAIDGSREAYIRIRDGLLLEGEIQEMNDEENFYDNGPYQASVCGFFLAYHQVVAHHWWLLLRPAKFELYLEFKVSLMRVMYLACSLISFILMERNFGLVHASGKREQGSGPPVDRWSNERACQEQRIGARGGS